MKQRVRRAWIAMKARVDFPNTKDYKNYGGRGITYDPRYKKFPPFYADVGDPPTLEHTLDRIDTDGDYVPGNMRWATRLEQARNKRNTIYAEIDGVIKPLAEWAEEYGIPYGNVIGRLHIGWSKENAVSIPVKVIIPRKRAKRKGMRLLYTIGTETKSFAQWCAHYNIHTYQFKQRMLEGQDPLTALTTPWGINITGYKGVSWDRRKNLYRATIHTKDARWEKCFKTAEEAGRAYLKIKQEGIPPPQIIENKTGFTGVSWVDKKQKYRARIEIKGKRVDLGYYKTAEEAHTAYLERKAL